jgi:hypothetical protein
MSEPAHIQFNEQQANLNARGEDVREAFSEDLNSLYQLSFLLTRDHEKAERCFVVGIEHLVRGNRAFNQWAQAWSKRIVVENAIREVKPRPGVAYSYSSAIVFPYRGQLSTPPGGHFELEAILALEDFERFVFFLRRTRFLQSRSYPTFLLSRWDADENALHNIAGVPDAEARRLPFLDHRANSSARRRFEIAPE